jgi:purine-binding chemotaxis protein CheW
MFGSHARSLWWTAPSGKGSLESCALDTAELEPTIASQSSDSIPSQLVTFRLGHEEYGVDIMLVQEIILIGQITQMPNVSAHVRGLINLRGHVIPVFDLRRRFALGDATQTDDSRIIVLNVRRRTIGIMVDAVDQVLRLTPGQIELGAGGMSGNGRKSVAGLVKLEDKLLILLNVQQIAQEETGTAS